MWSLGSVCACVAVRAFPLSLGVYHLCVVCVGVYSSIMALFTCPGGLRLTLIFGSWKPFAEKSQAWGDNSESPAARPVTPPALTSAPFLQQSLKARQHYLYSPPPLQGEKTYQWAMAFDAHCWSCLCVYPGLNDSLEHNNEMFSWYNWIVWVRQKRREGKREHVMEHVWDDVFSLDQGCQTMQPRGQNLCINGLSGGFRKTWKMQWSQ